MATLSYDQFIGFLEPSSITIFQDVVNTVNPKSILEVGFFKGGTSFYWLTLSNADLLSVDAMLWDGCSVENIHKLRHNFPERFSFICESSTTVYPKIKNLTFDLFFIDGGHTSDLVINDIQMGLDLEVPYMFLDDVSPNIFHLFQKMTKDKYEVVKVYDRKASREWIHMLLARRIQQEASLEELTNKWKRILNETRVEIPSLRSKLKRLWKKIMN